MPLSFLFAHFATYGTLGTYGKFPQLSRAPNHVKLIRVVYFRVAFVMVKEENDRQVTSRHHQAKLVFAIPVQHHYYTVLFPSFTYLHIAYCFQNTNS